MFYSTIARPPRGCHEDFMGSGQLCRLTSHLTQSRNVTALEIQRPHGARAEFSTVSATRASQAASGQILTPGWFIPKFLSLLGSTASWCTLEPGSNICAFPPEGLRSQWMVRMSSKILVHALEQEDLCPTMGYIWNTALQHLSWSGICFPLYKYIFNNTE